jgi:hypothetical protein
MFKKILFGPTMCNARGAGLLTLRERFREQIELPVGRCAASWAAPCAARS